MHITAVAVEDFTQAIELFKDDNRRANAYRNRGDFYDKTGQHENAIDDYTHAVDLFTDDKEKAITYCSRGNVYGELGEQQEAIDDFTCAIELFKDDDDKAKAYYNRGIEYVSRNQYKEAMADYIEAITRTCRYSRNSYKGKKNFYKFRPLNKNTLALLVQQEIYFSNIALLNDPLECPLVQENDFFRKDVFVRDYEPRICSLVLPCADEDKCKKLPEKLPVEDYLKFFSHYAEAYKGICIEYEITQEFLKNNKKMFYTPVQYQDTNRIESIEQIFALKNTQWKYESEARFVAFGERSTYPAAAEEGVKITKIFFGLKTRDEDKELVCRILHEQPGIQFFKSKKQGDSRLDVIFEPYNPPNFAKHTQ